MIDSINADEGLAIDCHANGIRLINRLELELKGAAAWWSMASQMAAQDYLARLHVASAGGGSGGGGSGGGGSGGGGGGSRGGSTSTSSAGFPTAHGYPSMSAADSLLASYASAMNASHSKSSNYCKSKSSNY